MKTFKCPSCGKQQTHVLQWQTYSKCFEVNLETNAYDEIEDVAGNIEEHHCPNCHEELPDDLVEKIEKQIL